MTLTDTLLRVAAPLRRAHTVGLLLPGIAAGVAALAGAAWLARLGAGGPALLVLIAWALLTLALAAGIVMGLRARGRLGASGVATRLEASGAWRRGALATLLAPLAEGTSDTLHRAAVDAETGAWSSRGRRRWPPRRLRPADGSLAGPGSSRSSR